MGQPEDWASIRRIAAGDQSALADFYDRHSRLVYSVAFNILGDIHMAEEVVQDVFIQIWKRASSYNPDQGKVLTWLTSVARHRAIDHFRRINVRPEGHAIGWDDCCEDESDDDAVVEAGYLSSEERAVIRRKIASLPLDQKQALSLAYFNGMTQQEIAEYLHQPLGTIKTRIRLGLQKLRSELGDIIF